MAATGTAFVPQELLDIGIDAELMLHMQEGASKRLTNFCETLPQDATYQ